MVCGGRVLGSEGAVPYSRDVGEGVGIHGVVLGGAEGSDQENRVSDGM